MRIDHVVLASADLDRTAARFADAYGLVSIPGGQHPDWGTVNRIVPLGDDYVEFLAIEDPRAGGSTALGSRLLALTDDGKDRWFSVCLADDGLDATAARLGLRVVSGSRVRPDGVEVRWHSAGLGDPARAVELPFFIRWDVPPELHPGRASASHGIDVVGIDSVDVAGSPGLMHDWLGEDDVPIRITEDGGEPGIRAVSIGLADGGSLRIDPP